MEAQEDNTYIVKGLPPVEDFPQVPLSQFIYAKLAASPADKTAIIDGFTGWSLTYGQLLAKSCTLARALRRLGYGKGSIIAICSENSIEFHVPIIASILIHAQIAPLNHNYTKEEIIHALNIIKPELVFCSKLTCKKFVELKRELPFIKLLIAIDEKGFGVESMRNITTRFYRTPSAVRRFPIEGDVNLDDTVFLLCSSGTTGLPKCAMLTHRNCIAKFICYQDGRVFSQDPGQTSLGILPFFHGYGLFTSLSWLMRQVRIVVMQKFDGDVFLKTIEKYQVTTMSVVPFISVFLAKDTRVPNYNLSSIQEIFCGAAPLKPDTEEVLRNRLKIEYLRQGYGMTETSVGGIVTLRENVVNGSCGKLVSHMLCKIRDPETKKSLGPGQVGELCFKGCMIMKGYYKNPEATKLMFTIDGWLRTGDLGYYDQDENFYIVDRLKELIKYKGFQVAPAELEGLLLSHEKIEDAGVVGRPDEMAGELPMAFVVKKGDLSVEEVMDFVKGKVSPQKWLRGGVVFVSAIPRNPSGKILRRKLREMLNNLKSKL